MRSEFVLANELANDLLYRKDEVHNVPLILRGHQLQGKLMGLDSYGIVLSVQRSP